MAGLRIEGFSGLQAAWGRDPEAPYAPALSAPA